MLGRHQGRNAPNAGYSATDPGATTAGTGAMGATAPQGATVGTNTANPSKTHGKLEEIGGKMERGIGEMTRNTNMT